MQCAWMMCAQHVAGQVSLAAPGMSTAASQELVRQKLIWCAGLAKPAWTRYAAHVLFMTEQPMCLTARLHD